MFTPHSLVKTLVFVAQPLSHNIDNVKFQVEFAQNVGLLEHMYSLYCFLLNLNWYMVAVMLNINIQC